MASYLFTYSCLCYSRLLCRVTTLCTSSSTVLTPVVRGMSFAWEGRQSKLSEIFLFHGYMPLQVTPFSADSFQHALQNTSFTRPAVSCSPNLKPVFLLRLWRAGFGFGSVKSFMEFLSKRFNFYLEVWDSVGKTYDLPILMTTSVICVQKKSVSDEGWYGSKTPSTKQEKFHCISIHSAEQQLHSQGTINMKIWLTIWCLLDRASLW